jgi:hypothetical protein
MEGGGARVMRAPPAALLNARDSYEHHARRITGVDRAPYSYYFPAS